MENTERTYHFKKTLEKKERFVGGHRLCAGCGAGIAVRGVLRALRGEDRAVVGNATGCLEVYLGQDALNAAAHVKDFYGMADALRDYLL